MTIDVSIGNPPYHEKDGGGTDDSGKPIYNLFIQQLKEISNYICFITPSRWMKGGKGLDRFRQDMMNDLHIKYITDYANEKKIFKELDIAGGVSYFLRDSKYTGRVHYKYIDKNEDIIESYRYLKCEFHNKIIRDVRQISIVEKVKNKEFVGFNTIVSERTPYGISADIFNNNLKYAKYNLTDTYKEGKLKIYGIKGIKGNSKRVYGYIDDSFISEDNTINTYKLFFSKAYRITTTIPPEIIVGRPGEICSETFLRIGSFNNIEITLNILKYIKTKFFRSLLLINRASLNISKSTFELIPLQDFTNGSDINWSLAINDINKQLYKKYNLSEQDKEYIERTIKPME